MLFYEKKFFKINWWLEILSNAGGEEFELGHRILKNGKKIMLQKKLIIQLFMIIYTQDVKRVVLRTSLIYQYLLIGKNLSQKELLLLSTSIINFFNIINSIFFTIVDFC
jgi:hypothetical protein